LREPGIWRSPGALPPREEWPEHSDGIAFGHGISAGRGGPQPLSVATRRGPDFRAGHSGYQGRHRDDVVDAECAANQGPGIVRSGELEPVLEFGAGTFFTGLWRRVSGAVRFEDARGAGVRSGRPV